MSNGSKDPTSKLRLDAVVIQTTVQVRLTLHQLYALKMAAAAIRRVDELYSRTEHPDIDELWNSGVYAANIDFVDDIVAATREDIAALSKFLERGATDGQEKST